MIQLLSSVSKYRFFWFIAIYIIFQYFGYDDLATILFFIAILDLARVFQENEESNK